MMMMLTSVSLLPLLILNLNSRLNTVVFLANAGAVVASERRMCWRPRPVIPLHRYKHDNMCTPNLDQMVLPRGSREDAGAISRGLEDVVQCTRAPRDFALWSRGRHAVPCRTTSFSCHQPPASKA